MSDDRETKFPLGASLTTEVLQATPYSALAALREQEPVSWIPALGCWLVTGRNLAIEAMRDAATFTVDDPRFSTAAVLGRSMLSLEGDEHRRHRSAFAEHFRPPIVRERLEAAIELEALRLVDEVAHAGGAELRSAVAGPLAVATILRFLGLDEVSPSEVLDHYGQLTDAIVQVGLGRPIPAGAENAIEELRRVIGWAIDNDTTSLVNRLDAEAVLHSDEIAAATMVVMFGAIETSEAMTANALWHLLSDPSALAVVRAHPEKIGAAIEESLRLEPAAAVIDRFATRRIDFGGAEIGERELVTISLLAANRDPATFPDPDRFDIERTNVGEHLAFVQGPDACIGLHIARLETKAAVEAVVGRLPDLALVAEASQAPSGLVFRKPAAVTARWRPVRGPLMETGA